MDNAININLIKGYMQQKSLSKSEFCKRCNISKYTYDKLLKKQKRLNIIALFNIAREMKLYIGDLIVK